METVRKPLNEDRVALLLGSVIFILALLKFSGIDMLGWAVKIGMWVGDPLDAAASMRRASWHEGSRSSASLRHLRASRMIFCAAESSVAKGNW